MTPLTPEILIQAYCHGIFPMAEDDGTIYWYDPDPRAILPLDGFHLPRSLRQRMRKGDFEIRLDTAFRQVIQLCAEPAPGREEVWISDEIVEIYCRLHDLGFAHSVETWMQGELVGGLYGVSLNGLFAGESMFSRRTDASKIALVYLIRHLDARGFALLDIQFMTEHLRRFGAIEIPRKDYQQRLSEALKVDAGF